MLIQIKCLIAFLFIFNGNVGFSQEIASGEDFKNNRRLFPSGIISKYAGGAGIFSAGIMWHPTRITAISLTAGYTPVQYGDIWSGNIYLAYTGIQARLHKNVSLRILETGIFINTNFGNKLYLRWPSHYNDNSYYWWNSAILIGPFTDANIIYSFPQSPYNIAFFIQANTNDLYIASYYTNKDALSIKDIIVLGAGIKITKRKLP